MRRGLFVPYGSLMIPIGSMILVADFFSFPSLGAYQLWFPMLWSGISVIGFIEAVTAYDFIAKARAASVQLTKNVMKVAFLILAVSIGAAIIPRVIAETLTQNESTFPDLTDWVAAGLFLVSSFPLAAGSLTVWDRWSHGDPDDLDSPYWSKPSRRDWMRLAALVGVCAGFLLDVAFPAASLFSFLLGAGIFLASFVLGTSPGVQSASVAVSQGERLELRKATYQEKVAIGRQACGLILQKYGRRVFAVCLWGDEEKNSEDPYSGVSLFVVMRDGIRLENEEYMLDGIRVQIGYWQEISLLRAARRFDRSWPFDSGSYRSRVVLFQKKEWIRKLDSAIAESETANPSNAIRDITLDLVHHLADARGDELKGDIVGVRIDCQYTALRALELVFLLNHRYVKKDYWKEVFECPEQPGDFRNRLEILHGLVTAPHHTVIDSLERLCEELFEMVKRRGISITSTEIKV